MINGFIILACKNSVYIALSLFLLSLLAFIGRYCIAIALCERNLDYLKSALVVIDVSSYILFISSGYAVFLIISVKYLVAHLVYKLNSLI